MLEDWETQFERFIKCPYCGYENPDSWEYSDIKGAIDYECPECEKVCILEQPEMEIYYTTRVKVATPNKD